MKTDVTTPGTYLQSRALSKEGAKKIVPGAPLPGMASAPDYKLDISDAARTQAQASAPSLSLPSVSLPSTPDIPKPDLLPDTKDIVKEPVKEEIKKKASEVQEVKVKDGTQKRPAVFFIKGLDMFSSPSQSEGGYAGVGRMAEAIEGSRLYGWDQQEEILKEIRKIHKDYPVIIVGHSLGGDTAVEIADALDSLEENFRKVDLLVTIDAIGFSHDVIPQNVKKHVNIFGESSILKDGPHVARREEMTSVRNILSPLDRTDIDDDKGVQFEIVAAIQEALHFKA